MDPNGLFLYFVYAFTTIFVIVNPVEATLVYVTLTASCSAAEKSRINRRTTTVAFSIAILFAWAGMPFWTSSA